MAAKQAIEGTRLNAFGVDPDTLVIIGLDTEDGPEHPLYDKRNELPLYESRVLNVMTLGVKNPILVRKDGERVLVVDGRQRVRWAREANQRLKKQGSVPMQVPVMVTRGDDSTVLGVMVSTNENREDNSLDVKLFNLQRLMLMGQTEAQAAVYFGVEEATIKGWLDLIEASPELKTAIKMGEISPSAGTQLAKLPRAQQAEVVKNAKAKGEKITTARANKIKKSNGHVEEKTGYEPTAKNIKRLVAWAQDGTDTNPLGGSQDYERGFIAALQWQRGEFSDEKVKNLRKALRKAVGAEESK